MTNWAKIIIGDSRAMPEAADGCVDLVVTSPPYWHIKDYGVPGQVGHGQTLHEYLKDLYGVWVECFRALRPGGRLCINIGDQFARAAVYGRYKIIPLHAEFIAQCEGIGFDFMGSIIWQKKTTMNTTGGAVVMGSYPYPPNGLVEIDYEYIQIFKKPGAPKKVSKDVKEASKLSKAEWKEFFYGHWHFGGARQVGHEAMFPEELPRRLIKMFTFVGDTVLDPFLGSGTTVKVALGLGRNALGYEINIDFVDIIKEKLGLKDRLPMFGEINFIKRRHEFSYLPEIDYVPRIQDASLQIIIDENEFRKEDLPKVVKIIDENTIQLNSGQLIEILGINVINKEETIKYLKGRVLGKQVIIINLCDVINGKAIKAYIYLKNKIFINSYLISSGLASPDLEINHKYKNKFIKIWDKLKNN